MITVDNSHNKRILINSTRTKAIDLKKEVEEKIKEIEENGSFDYSSLELFEHRSYQKNLSVFNYKKEILTKINDLKSSNITQGLKNDLDDVEENIYLILIGRFDKLKEYLMKKRKSNLVYTSKKEERKPRDFKKYKEVFGELYVSKLSTNDFKISFFKLFENMNVCPYCNRNFINPIYKKKSFGFDNKIQSPDIEHFFPKSMYPFLSLSISNLLPSCAFCNKIKSNFDTMEKCISPYEEVQDFKFKFNLSLKNINEYEISLETKSNNSKVLNLEDLYKDVHSDYINDIYRDVISHPEVLTNSLKNLLEKKDNKTKEWYESFFRNYYDEDEFNKHPLSKLTKDFYNHLKNLD